MEFKKIEEKLKINLNENRYRHTLGVAHMAASLAMAYDVDVRLAYRAGLLHDCAKAYSLGEQRVLCKEYGIEVKGILKKSPQLIHAALAPFVAKNQYGETNKEILDALECHTTGKPNMNLLEQILFIADYIEIRRRENPGLDTIRRLAFKDLDQCTLEILKNTINYLERLNQAIDQRTIDTYEYYKQKEK